MLTYWIGVLFFSLVMTAPAIGAVYVLIDGHKRHIEAQFWALAVFFLLPIMLPLYYALRPLRAGEKRTGGTVWSWAKNFAFVWGAVVGLVIISAIISSLGYPKLASLVILNLMLGVICWTIPVAVVFFICSFMREETVEVGPTGPVAANPSPTPFTKSQIAAIIAFALLGIMLFVGMGRIYTSYKPNKSRVVTGSS
jgi:hypothetical protein